MLLILLINYTMISGTLSLNSGQALLCGTIFFIRANWWLQLSQNTDTTFSHKNRIYNEISTSLQFYNDD